MITALAIFVLLATVLFTIMVLIAIMVRIDDYELNEYDEKEMIHHERQED
jgi:hypothetical protein